MTAAAALLAQLRAHGVRARLVEPDRVRLEAAAEPPQDLLEAARAHKPELVEYLRRSARCGTPADAVPPLLDCPGCGVTVWRPAGSKGCLRCENALAVAPMPHAVVLPAALAALDALGVTVTLGADGFALRTDPSTVRMSRAAFAQLVLEANALRDALTPAPTRGCAHCRETFRAAASSTYCSGRCREANRA